MRGVIWNGRSTGSRSLPRDSQNRPILFSRCILWRMRIPINSSFVTSMDAFRSFRYQRAVSSSRTSRHSVTSALTNNGPSSDLSEKSNPYSPLREFSGLRVECSISTQGIRPGRKRDSQKCGSTCQSNLVTGAAWLTGISLGLVA